jgi:hypothetical protein
MNSYVRVVAGLFALSVSTGDAEVKGARVSLVPKTAAVLNLMIENHRNSPMVEWQIGLFSHGGERRMTSFSNFSGRPSELQPRSGPIQPNERRTIEVELRTAPDVETAAMRLAVFEDGPLKDGQPSETNCCVTVKAAPMTMRSRSPHSRRQLRCRRMRRLRSLPRNAPNVPDNSRRQGAEGTCTRSTI